MSFEKRTTGSLPTPGPFLAEVTNVLDPTYMGRLEVALVKGIKQQTLKQEDTYVVSHLNPFYGVVGSKYEGNNSGSFQDVQQSYGMWFVPPDVGTTVMVIFVDGDPNQGYWIGSIQDSFQNYMVPGLAATKQVEMTEEQKRKYNTDYLPTGEFLKKTQTLDNPNPEKIAKPIHPFADRLLAQGLLLDTVRGVTSSSARREVPSSVFGISTPGPVDSSTNARRGEIGYEQKRRIPVTRLGGTTFVMDDGDVNGQNELVRIRTRTGHQILMHNSHDLIYIANGAGTAWIELTGNGKIDIYSQDSVSIHSENDFNFLADRDINIEAGRNIKMMAGSGMDVNVFDHLFVVAKNGAKINVNKGLDISVTDDLKITATGDGHLLVGKNLYQSAVNDLHIAASDQFQSATGNFNVDVNGNYIASAGKIHMNGPPAEAAVSALSASTPSAIPTYSVPKRSVSAGWSDGKFYKDTNLTTIMQRVPMHEPWDQHENLNPSKFTPDATDAAAVSRPDVVGSSVSGAQINNLNVVPGTCSIDAAKAIGDPKAQQGINAIKASCAKFGFTSPYAVAAILGIAGGESLWIPQTESCYYEPARLKQIFPKVTDDIIAKYARWTGRKEDFFGFFYGPTFRGTNFLGNLSDNDAGNFYGRGYIQITGRYNYASKAKLSKVDILNNPSLANDPILGADVAVSFYLNLLSQQTDPNFFQLAVTQTGNNSKDIYERKNSYYNCFLATLQGSIYSTGYGGIVTDSSGNPVKSSTIQP